MEPLHRQTGPTARRHRRTATDRDSTVATLRDILCYFYILPRNSRLGVVDYLETRSCPWEISQGDLLHHLDGDNTKLRVAVAAFTLLCISRQ